MFECESRVANGCGRPLELLRCDAGLVVLDEIRAPRTPAGHLADRTPTSRSRNRVLPYVCLVMALGHARAELRPRVDAELAVDAGEVRLDRLRAHERGRRDFAVRQTGCCELGDASLRWCQVVCRR